MQIILTPVPGGGMTLVTLDGDTLTVNGGILDLSDGTLGNMLTVGYEQDGALATRVGDTPHELVVIPRDASNDPPPPRQAEVEPPTEAETLAAMRPEMVAYRWQLMAALGEDGWAKVTAFGADPGTPWPVRAAIASAQVIPRASETVDTLAWVLGMSDEDADRLFAAAMALVA